MENTHCSFLFICLLFVYLGCIGSSLLLAGFFQLRQAGATLHCGVQASYCCGFSCCRAWALDTRVSVVATHGLSSCGSQALERRLSSCGALAQLLRGMWNLPGPGIEPVSPALAGGFLGAVPPGKSPTPFLKSNFCAHISYPSHPAEELWCILLMFHKCAKLRAGLECWLKSEFLCVSLAVCPSVI